MLRALTWFRHRISGLPPDPGAHTRAHVNPIASAMSELTRKPLQGLADPLAPVRYLDIVLLVLAAPIVILMGGPVLGYAVGAGVWIVQRIGEAWLDAAGHRTDPKSAVGIKFASMVKNLEGSRIYAFEPNQGEYNQLRMLEHFMPLKASNA